ncbi:MAG: hypothetical protein E7549_02205 [Ruminococcaceae bacterium]|nr:hypothetical protein [Oscillospiraceae bacterium]
MVKKLYKHEIEAYLRVWIPMQLVLLGIALLARGIQLFESDTIAYNIINGSSVVAFVLTTVVSIGLTGVFAIVRFYKNLFTGEGYLSFTLPVTPTQHILTKLFTALAFEVATVAVVLLAVSVVTAGDVFTEVLKAISFLWGIAHRELKTHLTFYVIEFAVFILISVMTNTLLYYGCIAVGQLFKKNRVLAAVGVYFGYYAVTQVFGTILAVIGTVTSLFSDIENFFLIHGKEAVHWVLCGFTVWYALLGVAYAFLVRYILTHKLNLE